MNQRNDDSHQTAPHPLHRNRRGRARTYEAPTLDDLPLNPKRCRLVLHLILRRHNWWHSSKHKGVSHKTMADRRSSKQNFQRQIMTLTELIEEYKKMASVCHNFDYADKKAVKRNNKAVSRMYEIVMQSEKSLVIMVLRSFQNLLTLSRTGLTFGHPFKCLKK